MMEEPGKTQSEEEAERARARVPRWVVIAVAVVVPVAAFFWNLGLQDLVRLDEAQRLTPPAEMVETGDWIIPRTNGEPYLNKPPLTYWLVAISYKLSGSTSVLAGRVALALACLVTVAGVMAIGARRGTLAIGVWSGVILATAVDYQQRSQQAGIDPLLTLMVLGCAYWTWRAVRRGNRRWLVPSLVAGVCAGLGMLTKGHTLLPFFVAGVVAAGVIERPRWGRLLAASGVALGVGLVIALPWFLLVIDRLGWERAWALFKFEGLERAGNAPPQGQAPVYYYLTTVPTGMLPWVPFLVFWAVRPFRRFAKEIGGSFFGFAGLFVVVAIVLYSLSSAKEARYVLPVFPFVALACGPVVEWAIRSTRPRPRAASWAAGIIAGWGVLLGVGAIVLLVGFCEWTGDAADTIVVGIIGTAWCLSVLPLVVTRHRRWAMLALAMGVVLVMVAIQDGRKRRDNVLDSVVPLLPKVDAYRRAGIPVYRYHTDLQGYYYLKNVTQRLRAGDDTAANHRQRDIAMPGDPVLADLFDAPWTQVAVVVRTEVLGQFMAELDDTARIVTQHQDLPCEYVLFLLQAKDDTM